ncbi:MULTISPECIES: hypothetical protein [Corynebacterium]|nr:MULTISPECIES: hypothetical protein [Corynebacterium]
MRFTILGLGTAAITLLAGASPLFAPAFIILGLAIDHNKDK